MVSIKVFISSVIPGLERERNVAERTIQTLELLPNRFETWPAHPEKPRDLSLKEVADSEIYILILGDSISKITIDEYKTARSKIPKRILVFVKDVQRKSDAEAFFNKIKNECTYKKFSTDDELSKEIKKGIQSLLFYLIKTDKDTTPEFFEEPLLEEEKLILEPKESIKYTFLLSEGDIINGIIDEEDGALINILLLDEENYVKKKNFKRFQYYGANDVGAYRFDNFEINRDGRWYLLIENNARSYDREIEIHLSVIR
jgi:hypothetical protein